MALANVRLYEPLLESDDDDDDEMSFAAIRDGIEQLPLNEELGQAHFFVRAQRALRRALGAARAGRRNETPGAARVATQLLHRLVEDADTLDSDRVVVGWSLATATWIIIAHIYALGALGDADGVVRMRASDSAYLRRTALVYTHTCVSTYTAAELVDALWVLRARLNELPSLDRSLLDYVRALEQRTALLLVGVYGDDVHDAREWRSPAAADDDAADVAAAAAGDAASAAGDAPLFVASREFIVASLWWLVAVRRTLLGYMRVASPGAFVDGARVVPEAFPRTPLALDGALVTRFRDFFAQLARTYTSEQHVTAFRTVAGPYTTPAGEAAAATHMRTDGEQVTWREALGILHSTAASDYASCEKFDVPLDTWMAALAARGDTSCGVDSIFESLIVLHLWRITLRAQTEIGVEDYGQWFVVMQHERADYDWRVAEGIAAGRPFLVQLLGRFGVVVPQHSTDAPADALAARVWARLGVVDVQAVNFDADAGVYECRNALEALVVWAAFLLDGWRGEVHRGRTCAPLLRHLFEQ